MLCALIAGAATVLAAGAEYRSRKSARRAEARAARRATESRLAMDAAEAARTAYIGFVRSEAAHNVRKI